MYNEPLLPESHPDYISEVEVLDTVEAVGDLLQQHHYQVESLGLTNDPQELIQTIRRFAPDGVINLYEGTPTHPGSELYAAGLLEWLGVSYTGCPFQCLVLARNKPLAKRLFVSEGLPTPAFLFAEGPLARCDLAFPVIVKPALQDASLGVDQQSVVTSLEQLNQRIAYVLKEFDQPCLVEEFIFGRELTYAIVEMPDLRFLPATEAIFPQDLPGYWPILTYDAKWTRGSREFEATDYHFHAQLPPELESRIAEYSRRAFRLLGCRDYARMDWRIRAGDDAPFLLEVNPNPDFAPDRALSNNLWAANIAYDDFVLQLVRNMLNRRQTPLTQRYRLDQLAG